MRAPEGKKPGHPSGGRCDPPGRSTPLRPRSGPSPPSPPRRQPPRGPPLRAARTHQEAVDRDAPLRRGWISATGGTLFINELAELPRYIQMRIQQWVQQGHWFGLDGTRYEPKSKLILATKVPPIALAERLADIYFSLIQGAVHLPTLRESQFELPRLIHAAFRDAARCFDITQRSISPSVMSCLCSYDWPGNLAELRRVAHHATFLSGVDPMSGVDPITLASLPSHLRVAEYSASKVLRISEFVPARSEPGVRFVPSKDSDSRSS